MDLEGRVLGRSEGTYLVHCVFVEPVAGLVAGRD